MSNSSHSAPAPSSRAVPLIDPFASRTEEVEPRKPLAPAALAAALLSLLPLGSVAAIPVGVVGLKQTRTGTLRGGWLAVASIAIGVLASVGYGGVGAYYAVDYLEGARRDAAERDERRELARERESREEPPDRSKVIPAPLISTTPSASAGVPAAGTVPQRTEPRVLGALTVVLLGVTEASLREALVREQTAAKAEGKQVLVMTASASCKPCDGVMESLSDPLMQDALSTVRLVRVDLAVFAEDLDRLGIQRDRYPGFFLLSSDGSPRDGIDGGEWEEDIARNIAPVLRPFVRGEYKNRKTPYRAVPSNGVFL